jgi:hypothetical protein
VYTLVLKAGVDKMWMVEEEEEPYLKNSIYDALPIEGSRLYPCTLPTAPVSRSFGLRSSYEIDILDTDQRPMELNFDLSLPIKPTLPPIS